MDILKIVAIGIFSTIAIMLVKENNKQMAVVMSIATGVLILLLILDELFDVVGAFYDIASSTGIDTTLFSNVIKVIGIGYLTEFAGNICIDAGSKNVADKILLAGKVCIMIIALPILTTLISVIMEILP